MEDNYGLFLFLLGVTLLILLLRSENRLKKANEQNQNLQFKLNEEILKVRELTKEKLNLEKELHEKKLENLRFVLNPHSVRNTLNTIYGLARRTFDAVLGLSGIFDYMLYESQQPLVTLKQELKFARQYLDLYCAQLTGSPRISLDLELEGHEDFVREKFIAPLITAHFIENAFKHGDFQSFDGFLEVKMEVVGGDTIIYAVRNKINLKMDAKIKGGLGKLKMKERLDLMYPNRYELDYVETSGVFSANLKLQLDGQQAPVHPRG